MQRKTNNNNKYQPADRNSPLLSRTGRGIKTWIRQVQVRMQLAKMNEEKDKYNYLIAALPPKITGRVYDLAIKEPVENPFTTLIKRIEEEFEPTDSEQIKKLLKGMNRGNTKPTVFLREMKTQAKDRVDNSVLKEMLLAQLPPVTAGQLVF